MDSEIVQLQLLAKIQVKLNVKSLPTDASLWFLLDWREIGLKYIHLKSKAGVWDFSF